MVLSEKVDIDNFYYSFWIKIFWSIPGSAAVAIELGKANTIKEDIK
jgi:hypothetical protein